MVVKVGGRTRMMLVWRQSWFQRAGVGVYKVKAEVEVRAKDKYRVGRGSGEVLFSPFRCKRFADPMGWGDQEEVGEASREVGVCG